MVKFGIQACHVQGFSVKKFFFSFFIPFSYLKEMDRASSPDYEPRSQRSAPAYVGSSQRPRGDDSAPYREPRGPPPERSTRAAPYNDGYARSERPPASGYRESAAYKEPADYDEAPYRSGRGTAPASGPYKESSTRARYYEDERPSSGYKEGPSYREPAGYKEPYAGREAAYEKPMTKGGYREVCLGILGYWLWGFRGQGVWYRAPYKHKSLAALTSCRCIRLVQEAACFTAVPGMHAGMQACCCVCVVWLCALILSCGP